MVLIADIYCTAISNLNCCYQIFKLSKILFFFQIISNGWGGGGQEVGVSNDYTIITVSDAVTRHSRYIVEKST